MPEREGLTDGGAHDFLNVREEMMRRRSAMGRVIDATGHKLATPAALGVLLAFHVVWVVLNVPGVISAEPWDPPPFTLLATIASALAPFLSIMILMAQYRDSRIAELRGELALQIALRGDRQLVLVLRALDERARTAVDEARELRALEQPLDATQLLHRVRRHLEGSEGRTVGEREEGDGEGEGEQGDGEGEAGEGEQGEGEQGEERRADRE